MVILMQFVLNYDINCFNLSTFLKYQSYEGLNKVILFVTYVSNQSVIFVLNTMMINWTASSEFGTYRLCEQ